MSRSTQDFIESKFDPIREIELEPEYYGGAGNYSVIEAIERWGLGYHLGQVVKYVARAGKKVVEGDARKSRLLDLRKARWYLDREIARMETESEI